MLYYADEYKEMCDTLQYQKSDKRIKSVSYLREKTTVNKKSARINVELEYCRLSVAKNACLDTFCN